MGLLLFLAIPIIIAYLLFQRKSVLLNFNFVAYS